MSCRVLLALAVPALLVASACRDVQAFTFDKDDPVRPVGEACTLDSQCESGRCFAGVCDDGSCESNADCESDELCVLGTCLPDDSFECKEGDVRSVSVTPGSLAVNFGQVRIGQVQEETVTIENIGDCLLTLNAAGLDDAGHPDFSCEPCDPSTYPQFVPPTQSLDIIVRYTPQSPGVADSTLFINTDAQTADDGLISVSLHAEYDGEPLMVINPAEVNFGRVPYEAGGVQGEATETVEITNRGTGNAALVIERLFVNNGVAFSIPAEFADINPDNPLVIPPFDANDPTTTVTVPITFRPNANADFFDQLIVRPSGGANATRDLKGTSKAAPNIVVNTADIIFKCGVGLTTGQVDPCPLNEGYPAGTVTFRTLDISNNGGSDLVLNMTTGGEDGDFSVSPSLPQPIPAGGHLPITIFFQPSGPSDLANPFNPQSAFDAVLNITSNDNEPASDVLKSIALKGFSKGSQNDQTLKLEMEYQNADNSWAGNDFRDVDLELEAPLGVVCKKNRNFIQDSNGNFFADPNQDPCDEWNDVSDMQRSTDANKNFGHTTWVAGGQYEEPERVILFGIGPTASEGQVFKARVYYIEDCANIPTGLLADLLGIGGSILLGVLGASVGVPIAVNPDTISDFVGNNCFDHASSTTTLHISIDGIEVAAPQHRLDHKGDVFEMAHLKRTGGQFCDPQVGLACP
jgi:hypothetical protein